jgi:heat shock protein beta
MQAACKNAPDSSDAKRAVDLLYDTALISSGFTVRMRTDIFEFF